MSHSSIGFRRDIKENESKELRQHVQGISSKVHEIKGWQEAQKILSEYFNPYYKPLVTGERRNQMYMEKLEKVKVRYFDPI